MSVAIEAMENVQRAEFEMKSIKIIQKWFMKIFFNFFQKLCIEILKNHEKGHPLSSIVPYHTSPVISRA